MSRSLAGLTIILIIAVVLTACIRVLPSTATARAGSGSAWTHLSSKDGDLAPPSNATQQTASLVLDVDRDGAQDFVIGCRQAAPSMV